MRLTLLSQPTARCTTVPVKGRTDGIPLICHRQECEFALFARPQSIVYQPSGTGEWCIRALSDHAFPAEWISTGGGYQPLWRRDGKELLYFSEGRKPMSVDVSTSPSFKAASPKLPFAAPLMNLTVTAANLWGIAPDGQRFLLNVEAERAASAPMTVVVNWQAGLKK
jgi:hypothetical protein